MLVFCILLYIICFVLLPLGVLLYCTCTGRTVKLPMWHPTHANESSISYKAESYVSYSSSSTPYNLIFPYGEVRTVIAASHSSFLLLFVFNSRIPSSESIIFSRVIMYQYYERLHFPKWSPGSHLYRFLTKQRGHSYLSDSGEDYSPLEQATSQSSALAATRTTFSFVWQEVNIFFAKTSGESSLQAVAGSRNSFDGIFYFCH